MLAAIGIDFGALVRELRVSAEPSLGVFPAMVVWGGLSI